MLQHRLQMAGLAAVSLFAGLLFFALLRPQGIGLEFYFPVKYFHDKESFDMSDMLNNFRSMYSQRKHLQEEKIF